MATFTLPPTFWDSGSLISLSCGSLLIGYGAASTFSTKLALDPNKPAFYYPDFFLKISSPWIQYENWLELSIEQFDGLIEIANEECPVEWMIGHQDLFYSTFSELQQAFQEGKLKKAVPYTFAYSYMLMSKKRLKKSLKTALIYMKNFPSYLYGFWNQQEGLLGLTPETLFLYNEKHQHTVCTMALAGTKKQRDKKKLEQDNKEKHEHQIVVTGICQALQAFGSVKIGERQIRQFSHLNHLFTPIEVNLIDAFDFEQLVKALHPTPALGAFPRSEGLKWLESYQKKLERKYYGAPVGIIDPNSKIASCFVGIRNVQWNAQGMRIGAGCGIVQGSECEQEWNEILLKIQAIRNCLNL